MDALPSQSVKAILGPTNTGKTYFAIERLLAHSSGMIGLPLRLLAREVYHRIVERVGVQAVALVTGEERIVPPKARYWVATVEAMPLDLPVECVAIDEIQTAIDFDRGHVFTHRILHARGLSETLLLGAATMAPVIRQLLPHAEIIYRPRLSELTYAGSRKISRQPERSAIVAFSASQVYAIAELIRRERGGAAVVMGALSPRTRNAQVELYQNGDVDFLVATDAIGMGLNLDVRHVAFADDTKFDGRQSRPLTPAEFGQIAGRAGRHVRNGTFGVTGGTEPFDEDLIRQLESHDFEPVKVLQWRNAELDFASIDALRHSLDRPPAHKALTRVPVATDQLALEFLSRNESARLASNIEAVKLLWEVCQTPDYRDISPAQHGEIVTKIYTDLRRRGAVEHDWLAEQVRFCDSTVGDIDTLSNRIRQIRTWTFVANRKNWLADPAHWREKTRDIEDRLSDALHEKLIQRFVDRRTSVLIRHLRDRLMANPEVNDRGEVSLEGHLIGTLDGFRFTLARSDGDLDAKGLRAAADQVVAPEIAKRADRLSGAPNEEFVLTSDGRLRWRGEVVAELAEGDALLRPRIIVLADESLTGSDLERVQDRLNLWVRHAINTQLEPIVALAEPADLEGTARGLAFRLSESLGILPRAAVADDVKGLDQDVRAKLRKHGIKFGAYHIYLPATLKPAPRELALILFALKNGGVRQPGVTDLPHLVLSGRTSFLVDPEVSPRLYEVAGFKVAGKRAVRVDILERLADIIRPLISLDAKTHQGELPAGAAEANGFRVTVEMTSLLGCAGEEFASILNALGYRVRRTPKLPTVETPVAPAQAAGHDGGSEAMLPLASEPVREIESDLVDIDRTAETEAPVELSPIDTQESVGENTSGGGAPESNSEPKAFADEVADEPAPLPELATPAAAESLAESTTPAEPEFDEVWFPAGRRQNERRSHGPRRETRSEDGEGGERRPQRRPQGERPNRDGQRPDNRRPENRRPEGASAEATAGRPPFNNGNGRPRFDKPREERRRGDEERPQAADRGDKRGSGKSFERPQRPAREPVFDPDSPFAALAALRNRKPE